MPGSTDLGTVRIRNEVIGTIASMAAQEVKGVVEVWKGSNPLASLTGQSGVRVETVDQDVQIWMNLVVEYGVNLPEVASAVQDQVREMIEQMTQLHPTEVHVAIRHVQTKKGGTK